MLGMAFVGCNPHFEPTPEPYGRPDPPPTTTGKPSMSSISPVKALPGSVITINGLNFALAGNTATINGTPAVVNAASPTEILITVPADMPVGTTGQVVLNSGGTTLTSSLNFTAIGGTVSQFTAFNPITISRFLITRLGDIYGITPDAVLKTQLGEARTVFSTGNFGTIKDIATYENETGELYVCDSLKRQIFRVSLNSQVALFAGSGSVGYNDGTNSSAQFAKLNGLAFDGSGNLYIADEYRVRKISGSGVVTTVAGSPSFADINGTGTAARFGTLTAIATDAQGNIFVADNQYKKIRKITPAGVTTTLAGSGATGFADGAATSASFNSFGGMAIDAAGNVFVSDRDPLTPIYKIRMINKVGLVTTLLTGFSNTSVTNGPLANATVSKPDGLTFDIFGNLYIFNAGTRTVNKVTFQ